MTWTLIARDQAGLILRSQLMAAGVRPRTIDLWTATGRLERLRVAGVHRVGGAADSESTAAWFAALSTRSPVSYLSAAAWWGMSVPDDGLVHITRFGRRRLDWPPGVRVHRVALARTDVETHRGLWVTTRPVTAMDCIGWLSPGRALIFADRALQQTWVSLDDIRRRLEHSPGRWGNRQLRRIANTVERGAEAESERRLHRLLRRAGVTGWVPNLSLRTAAGHVRIDVAFPALRLAIEVDGYAYHSRDERYQRDRTRQNALVGAGWRVLRFTWADIVDRPAYVLGEIRPFLAA